MASISKDPGGQRRILFMADGKRLTVRLGKVSQREAEAVKVKVERLVSAKLTRHPPDDETARWLAQLDTVLADRLVRVGLIAPSAKPVVAPLGTFLDAYVAKRIDVKPATQEVWSQTTRNLRQHFGEDRDLPTIICGIQSVD